MRTPIRPSPSASHDTVTVNACVADRFEPSASVAVTLTSDSPADSAVTLTVTTPPDTDTAATSATSGADDSAAYVSTSPSRSRNAPDTSTDGDSPTSSLRSASVPTA